LITCVVINPATYPFYHGPPQYSCPTPLNLGNHRRQAHQSLTKHTNQPKVCCRMLITIEIGVWCQHTPSSIVTTETGRHGKPTVTQITHTRVLNIPRCFHQEISSQECDESEYFLARGSQIETIYLSLILWSTLYNCAEIHGRCSTLPCHKNVFTIFSRSKSSWEFNTVTTGRRAFQLYSILAKQPALHPSPSLYLQQTLRDICILAFTKWNI